MNYNIDFVKLVKRLIPPFLRTTDWLNLANVIIVGVSSVHQLFMAYVADKEIEKNTTGQTMLLERYLNYVFDRSAKRIYIKHVEETNEYDFLISEEQESDFDFLIQEQVPGEFMNLLGEGNRDLTTDFLIYVPQIILSLEEPRIRANVNKYKLAGKQFDFVSI